MRRRALALFLAVACLLPFWASGDEPVYDNPLLNPQANLVSQYTPVEGDILNILLLGFDRDLLVPKPGGKESHSDTMMVLAINRDLGRADLISVPRDMVAYVPGTRGLYKINGAVNVGGTRAGKPAQSPEGLQAAKETVCWVLGGIRIHHVVAVGLGALRAIGDAIGGVDFDMDMNYPGSNGRVYRKGRQHLDGIGIVDYVQARRNASIRRGSDIARTDRQRRMLLAMVQKILGSPGLLLSLLDAVQNNPKIREGFHTDMSPGELMQAALALLPLFTNREQGFQELVTARVLDGRYRSALGGWNFTFIDQENRIRVLREVYGVTVPELPYISYEYAGWLHRSGFDAVRRLSAAEKLMAFAQEHPELLKEDGQAAESYAAFTDSYRRLRSLFASAAGTMDPEETKQMKAAAGELVRQGDALGRLIGYPGKNKRIAWRTAQMHDNDPLVNEVYVNFR